MPPSEIDEIFASKGKSSAAAPSSSSQAPEKKKKKKDKSAKRKRDDADADAEPADAKPVKRKVPETVFDPSAALPSAKPTKARKADRPSAAAPKTKKPKKDREEEERFKDSRGTGPRRTTEEGFAIYKEDELGITDQGGGQYLSHTSQVSSSFSVQIPRCVHLIVNAVSEMYHYLPLAVAYRRYPANAIRYRSDIPPALSKPRLPLRQWQCEVNV
ncbi:hypothetical protein OH77DRAFT_459015 [Trametes cingulata]|nr:hypothetical protein OH77DRAFT_459015 [Trametes cingulata]